MGTFIALSAVLLIVYLCIKDLFKSHQSAGCGSCSNNGSCNGSCSECGNEEILVTIKRRK
ncbi:MAG: hypothetical protein IJT72_01980 [Lachnospiraceae bacterium]|nr:hypothetical protein [Lachnospiraceae bacterium]